MKSSSEIRQTFFDFFEQKLHQIVPSAPIVQKNDPTLMFTNAGMNQFKDIFLGVKPPTSPRVADTQKCLRVSGKHNDLDEVGHDTYHHTMFEMLGNWSFADYYKEDAIKWAWTLLTERFELPAERLYATVFGGDEGDKLGPDAEAEREWEKYLPKERILYGNKKDNFWEMGDTGPAGPCSEIHLDLRPEAERKATPGHELVNADHPQVVEVWNLVFIQFERRSDGSLRDLPQRHVDTGMGFERLVMALQGKTSTYDTDLFDPTRSFLERRTGLAYAEASEAQQIAMRVVMDHIRAIVFTIADGQIPSNTGAGYVIRRILRRASRYAFSYLSLTDPFLNEMVPLLATQYRDVFPEVHKQLDFIQRIILEEEKGFLRKLESGSIMFEEYLQAHPGQQVVDGDFAFKLYDTFGFPIDLTQVMAREHQRTVDMEGFERNLAAQKARSRQASETQAGDWEIVHQVSGLPVFVGYDTLEMDTRILQQRQVKAKKKTLYQIVLEETPFYAESGGQVGDQGTLSNGQETLKVLDTQWENELIIHTVDRLPANPEGSWRAVVDGTRRRDIKANHSATHLMHAALRRVLGPHVEQRGSLVTDELLRFDFSHFAKVSNEELSQVEQIVNEKIASNIPLIEYRGMPIEEAKAMGAMALFGEKYGEQVRVIIFDQDYSVELCGGTHVAQTGDIRLFKFRSEGSVAAGIRRVEAVTGKAAIEYLSEKADTLDRVMALLKGAQDPEKAVANLIEKQRQLEKELHQLNAEKLGRLSGELKAKAQPAGDIQLIREIVSVGSADDLKQLAFDLKKITENTLVVLGAVVNEKPLLSVIMSDELANSGRFHAGNMVRTLARNIQGGGGGQPFFATAGGKNPDGLQAALDQVTEFV
ncbi:MAG: alanine--tRNA ligase [Bacteroidetes bacterium]|nr:MAG: alanine--tRNA ligase [Bacteroidota bacterium]